MIVSSIEETPHNDDHCEEWKEAGGDACKWCGNQHNESLSLLYLETCLSLKVLSFANFTVSKKAIIFSEEVNLISLNSILLMLCLSEGGKIHRKPTPYVMHVVIKNLSRVGGWLYKEYNWSICSNWI